MSKCVIVREDDRDVARVVCELLSIEGYDVVTVGTVEQLLMEAARRVPCVALIDGTSPVSFDLWWLGPRLRQMGVPPVAFTAHSSARREFAEDPHGYVGVMTKPFDAEEFVQLI